MSDAQALESMLVDREYRGRAPLREELHFLLQTLWSKAVGTDTYDKKEWMALQQSIFLMEGFTPPPPDEPDPYGLEGSDLTDSDDTTEVSLVRV